VHQSYENVSVLDSVPSSIQQDLIVRNEVLYGFIIIIIISSSSSTQPPVQWVPGLSRGLSAAGACC